MDSLPASASPINNYRRQHAAGYISGYKDMSSYSDKVSAITAMPTKAIRFWDMGGSTLFTSTHASRDEGLNSPVGQ